MNNSPIVWAVVMLLGLLIVVNVVLFVIEIAEKRKKKRNNAFELELASIKRRIQEVSMEIDNPEFSSVLFLNTRTLTDLREREAFLERKLKV
jgi:hypothetical protein